MFYNEVKIPGYFDRGMREAVAKDMSRDDIIKIVKLFQCAQRTAGNAQPRCCFPVQVAI